MSTRARQGIAAICYALAGGSVGAFIMAIDAEAAEMLGSVIVAIAGLVGLWGLVALGRGITDVDDPHPSPSTSSASGSSNGDTSRQTPSVGR